MRLGFHYHVPAIKRDGVIYMPGYLGVFIDSLAEYCESVICFMHEPMPDEVTNIGYKIKSSNIHLVYVGLHTCVPKRLMNTSRIRKIILEYENRLDIVLIRVPTPLVHVFSKAFTVPIALLIVGDYLAGIDQLPQPFWRKEIIRLWIKWNYYHQLLISKKALVFVVDENIYQNLINITDNVMKIKSTTISSKDIFSRKDTCESETTKLLFVGRFDRSKGLFELYNALSQLKNSGNKYHLCLVGWQSKGDTLLEELDDYAGKLGIKQTITNLGYKNLGSELFDVYKNTDIYVLPTKYDDFPRTIWEAMAHSLPVVSTKVGSIPVQLTNGLNAILVEPGDSEAFADAINNVANDKQLRQKLIKEGRELASQNTLEIQSKKMIDELEKYIIKNDE